MSDYIIKDMNIQFADLIENSPKAPGVYKMYAADGALLYVGKAKNLSARLKQYMDISKLEPHKRIMRGFVANVEWIATKTESDALVLEQELIKTEKPKYNIMLTDGKMYPYLVLTDGEFPRLEKIRARLPNKKDVFGPYPGVSALNDTIKIIQKVCKIRTCTDSFMRNRTRPCLLYQIGRCSAPCCPPALAEGGGANAPGGGFKNHYSDSVNLALRILSGDAVSVIKELSAQMERESARQDYEAAAATRDKIAALSTTAIAGKRRETRTENMFGESFADLEKFSGKKLDTVAVFDNSHLFGKSPVGSMIVFNRNGFVKSEYKKFHLKNKSAAGNDIAMMDEFIKRAISHFVPTLIIVDGGRAQWNAAKHAAKNIPIMGVVKGEVRNGDEHFILPSGKESRDLPRDGKLFLMLRRVRDEAHRFAITFNRRAREKSAVKSVLDEIDGIGPKRKKALLHHFGGARNVANADEKALARIPEIGPAAAKKIYSYFHG
jgi:excinuclease UvrABC nuclease subunit